MDDTTQQEIADLLQEREISQEAATRLILRTQSRMMTKINSIKTIATTANAYNKKYPSLTWLFSHRRKTTITVAFIIFAFFYSVFVPITIADIRESLLATISGIP